MPQLSLGILIDQKYNQFSKYSLTCHQKQQLLSNRKSFTLPSEPHDLPIIFNIQQTVREHIWYLYVYSCDETFQEERENMLLKLHVSINLLNRGSSHFGEDEGILGYIYFLALAASLVLLPRNLKKFKKNRYQGETDYAHNFITLGLVLLSVSYTLRLLHLIIYAQDGQGLGFVDIISLIFRSSSESIVVILLVVISWGWTVTYIHGENDELYIPIGAMLAIVNITCTAIGKVTDEFEDKHHHFDAVTGWIVLCIRSSLGLLFLAGVVKTYREARPKAKQFVKEFGALGFAYIAAYPFAVILCQLIFPPYMQNEWILAITEFLHVTANGLLTYMVTSSKSAYQSLQYSQRTVFQPVSGKVF